MKNMVYIQSGGPTSVINTSFYGAVREAQRHPDEIDHIYGSVNGVEGLIDDNLIDIGQEDDEQIELLLQTPEAFLVQLEENFLRILTILSMEKLLKT